MIPGRVLSLLRPPILRQQVDAGIHYHQFLKAGENTLNFKLAAELVRLCKTTGGYDSDAWLARSIDFMLTPGSHRDTYVEEYHRGVPT